MHTEQFIVIVGGGVELLSSGKDKAVSDITVVAG